MTHGTVFRAIRLNVERMDELIDELLHLSRIGQRELQFQQVSMKNLVEETLIEMKPDIPEHAGIHVEDLPDCHADLVLMHQVLINLISNALKFSSGRAQPEITIGNRSGSYFVKDNGVGFDMEYSEKMFGVFQRLHTEKEFEGSGVGLAIVERIIQRHGGEIQVRSAPGEGGAFYFSIEVPA